MIDYLSKEQVAAMLTTGDRAIDPKTVYRWVNEGLTVGGRRVKLRAIRLPTGMAFTRDLVDAFIAELNSVSVGRTTYFTKKSARRSTRREIEARVAASVPSRRPVTAPFYRCPDNEIGMYPGEIDVYPREGVSAVDLPLADGQKSPRTKEKSPRKNPTKPAKSGR